MLTSQKIITAMNEQIGNEFGAMLQYVAIAAYFDAVTLPELCTLFYRQAEEEKEHAHRILKYVVDTGGALKIPGIPAPKVEFKTTAEAVELSLAQEIRVSAQINAIVEIAKNERDYTTENFLQWFVSEQLEEVTSMEDLLHVVRRAGEDNLLRVEDYLARKGGGGGGTGFATQSAS